jgi:hypothetical protein
VYRAALKSAARSSAVPYGYTLTVWSSGAVLMRSHGAPPVADVFLFLAGGVAAFVAIALLSAAGGEPPEPSAADLLTAGALNVVAVAGSVAAAALVAEIGGAVAWPLGAFAATLVYLLLSSLELLVARRA